MDLQTSPFPPFRGRDRLIAAVDAVTAGDAGRITADLQLALQEAITDSRIELPECVHRSVIITRDVRCTTAANTATA